MLHILTLNLSVYKIIYVICIFIEKDNNSHTLTLALSLKHSTICNLLNWNSCLKVYEYFYGRILLYLISENSKEAYLINNLFF